MGFSKPVIEGFSYNVGMEEKEKGASEERRDVATALGALMTACPMTSVVVMLVERGVCYLRTFAYVAHFLSQGLIVNCSGGKWHVACGIWHMWRMSYMAM